MPKVTAIIPTYNWSSVLPYSIGSALNQTFSDFELLVIGDGCTDDSGEVVEEFARRDARVRWINLERNVGNQYGPNNEGIRVARGEYIAHLGHDDLWMPRHLERLVAQMESGADMTHSLCQWILSDDSTAHWWPIQQLVTPAAVMYRKSVTEKIGVWRDYRELVIAPDEDFFARIRGAGFKEEFSPHLGVLKFPAMTRKNVYKDNPCHEQKAYFERMTSESDFEIEQLRRMVVSSDAEINHWRTQCLERVPVRFKKMILREIPAAVRAKFGKKTQKEQSVGAKVKKWREFKGLDA